MKHGMCCILWWGDLSYANICSFMPWLHGYWKAGEYWVLRLRGCVLHTSGSFWSLTITYGMHKYSHDPMRSRYGMHRYSQDPMRKLELILDHDSICHKSLGFTTNILKLACQSETPPIWTPKYPKLSHYQLFLPSTIWSKFWSKIYSEMGKGGLHKDATSTNSELCL